MSRVAIFDLDGTLMDSAPAITRALNGLIRARGLPAVDVAQVRTWVSLGVAALLGRALGQGCDADDEEIAAFRAIYAIAPGSREDLYPGVAQALSDLSRAGVLLALCTNKPQALAEEVLRRTGIAHHFNAVVGGDVAVQAKPDAAHVVHTLMAMGSRGASFDFIGDSSVDMRAAHASGGRFLWASWGYADADLLAPPERTLRYPSDIVPAVLHGGMT